MGGPSPINQAANRGSGDTTLTLIGGDLYVGWGELDGVNKEVRVSRFNAAGTAWEQVVGGPSPINVASDRNAFDPELAGIGGVPHVAWAEFDGVNDELRVSRPNAAGTAWDEVVGGASPINQASDRHASTLDLTDVGGVPYVVWREPDGVNAEVRVSRLNAAGNAWEQVEGGASPINESPTQSADFATIATIGGVPYVAWSEFDGVNGEIRVSRLNAAGNAWDQVAGGPSPINHSSTSGASHPSLADVGGVPHVAWRETDGAGNDQIRVSRLNAGGTAWEQVVGGPSPVNQASDKDASRPSLTAIGGVPYLAWAESDGTNDEVRVSRLNAAGTAWEQIVGGTSPINQASDQGSGFPSLTAVGGVPYIAWVESDGTNDEVRVSRLEPDFLASSETVTDTTATLSAEVRTYGVLYPIGFEYGPGSGFGSQAGPAMVQSGNGDSAVATQSITGLDFFTDYSWRPFGTDLTRQTAIGPTRSFRTTDTAIPTITGARVAPRTWAVDPKGRPEARANRRRAKRSTTFRFTLSEAARVVFRIARKARGRKVGRRCRKQTRRNRGRRRCTRFVRFGSFAYQGSAGSNRKRFSGRIGRKKLRRGRYRATLVATDPAGNRSKPKRLSFRVVRR